MEHIFVVIGYCTVTFVLIWIIKLIFDTKESSSIFIEDHRIYEAAHIFVQGDSKKDEVKEILLNCIDFDEDEANEIISRAEKGRSKKDDYVEFLKAVNSVLEKNIYNTYKD